MCTAYLLCWLHSLLKGCHRCIAARNIKEVALERMDIIKKEEQYSRLLWSSNTTEKPIKQWKRLAHVELWGLQDCTVAGPFHTNTATSVKNKDYTPCAVQVFKTRKAKKRKEQNRCLGKAIAMLVPMSTWLHCLQQTRSLAIATRQCSAEKPALAAVGGVAGRAGGLAMGRGGIPDGGDFNKPNIRRKGMTADSISEASPETSTALL